MREITCKLEIELSTVFKDEESEEETVKFCVLEDLQDNGYAVNSIKVIESEE